MKKISLLWIGFFLLLQTNAQTKISTTNVIGKWALSSIEVPGMLFYDVDKDSLSLGEKMKVLIKEQSPVELSMDSMIARVRPSMVPFAKTIFQFNVDGTAGLFFGVEGSYSNNTFSVDEENATIAITDKNKKTDIYQAVMIHDKLLLSVKSSDGEYAMTFKKIKP